VDVGPLVRPHPEAAKLTEPGKDALDDPPPRAQATPMRGVAHGQEGHDMTNPETAPNRRRVVAPIPEHVVRPLPRSSAGAVRWGNRVHQREDFLRVVPIRTGQTHRQRHAPPVADQMPLAPALGPTRRGGVESKATLPFRVRNGYLVMRK
jgi:hypothetical protein